jgi:hypothetical protein
VIIVVAFDAVVLIAVRTEDTIGILEAGSADVFTEIALRLAH